MEENQEKIGENRAEDVQRKTKYCKFCGAKIPVDAVICTSCGRQVEELKKAEPQIIVNNANTNTNVNHNVNTSGMNRRAVDKWVSFILCLLFGYFGAHKFYEGNIGMGILYLLTGGLCGIMWVIDCIIILTKPNPYYV